jgi:hypothetical protein
MFLKKVSYWLNSHFKPSTFSDFAYLGDLKRYHLTDLQNKLKDDWKEEICYAETHQEVTWHNDLSSYTVYFSLQGDFIQIKDEIWKSENLTFTRDFKEEYPQLELR